MKSGSTTKLLKVTGLLMAALFMNIACGGGKADIRYTFVNDFANILSQSTEDTLTQSLRAYQKSTGHEVMVVTLPDLGGEPIENKALAIYDQVKIGRKGEDDGVIILVALAEKKVRIQLGYGAETVQTDAQTGDIIRKAAPKLAKGEYDVGVTEMVRDVRAYMDKLPAKGKK